MSCIAAKSGGRCPEWVNQVISGAVSDFRFSPRSDRIAALRQPTRRSSRRNRRKRNLSLYFQFHSFQSSVAHFGHAVCHLPPRCWRTRQPNSWAAIHNACNSDRLLIVSSASKRALHTSHTKAVLLPCLSMLMARLEGSRQFAPPCSVHG